MIISISIHVVANGIISFSLSLSFFFRPHHTAWGILVPQPGIKPAPLAVEAQILNHRTTREVRVSFFFMTE